MGTSLCIYLTTSKEKILLLTLRPSESRTEGYRRCEILSRRGLIVKIRANAAGDPEWINLDHQALAPANTLSIEMKSCPMYRPYRPESEF